MKKVEKIVKDGIVYAIIIKSDYITLKTGFITEKEDLQQVGFIIYSAGEKIQPHLHKSFQRTIDKTTETLFIKEGKLEYQIFDNVRSLISNGILEKGDIITLLNGGHGFTIIEDAILIEVKQGPFISTEIDKERFNNE